MCKYVQSRPCSLKTQGKILQFYESQAPTPKFLRITYKLTNGMFSYLGSIKYQQTLWSMYGKHVTIVMMIILNNPAIGWFLIS